LKTKRNWLASIILFVLLASLASPLIASQTSATEAREDDDVKITPGTWYKLESDIITVLFPASGQKPMFIWWYTNEPNQVYVVKFQGLVEWFAFDHPLLLGNPETYNHLREAWQETWRDRFRNWYFKPEEERWMGMGDIGRVRLMIMQQIMYQIMQQMQNHWHRAYLPFNAGTWSLGDIHNITTPEGKVIGVAFAFTLKSLPEDKMPNMQFAENNIMIRVRFYNETVEETVPGTDYKYTVNAGEMKMDLVVNKWEWNIDTLKELVQQLQQEGFDITIPEGKSRLALWVNLASINMTKLSLAEAQKEPEEIEHHSTATHMDIEDEREDITINKTETETELERPIEIPRPIIKIKFSNETDTLGGFFRYVSSAKISDYPETGDVSMVPVKAAYIAAGAHMRLFLSYPYFGNGTLEHDPSIGVDAASVDTTPKYTVQTPSGNDVTPIVSGTYIPPLFSPTLMLALITVISTTAIVLYAIKWKRKTPVNMVGVGK
jgi:hypothetical protein